MFTWTPYKHAIIAYIWRENMLKNLSAKSFPRASLFENCELRGTGTVEGPRSEHILKPNGGFCVYLSFKIYSQHAGFANWRISLDIPYFYLEYRYIQSSYASRPIVLELKYLKDYKSCNFARLDFITTRFQFSVSCYQWYLKVQAGF